MSAAAAAPEIQTPSEVIAQIEPLKKKTAWEEIAELARFLPEELSREWLEVADDIAFALGRIQEIDRAVALLTAAHELAPTARRASSRAYQYYDALLQNQGRGIKGRDRDADKEAFRRCMVEALDFDTIQVKNLYRLGVFEAQVEHRHDRAALRAFLNAIELYRSMDSEERARRHDLKKFYIRSLYAGARSALRLGEHERARQLIFACIREDHETDHEEPLFKLFLAGKVCMAMGWLEHAERAFRKALDAPGPHRRSFVFAKLAELCLIDNRPEDAERWLEDNIPPHQRQGAVWRLAGKIREAGGRTGAAVKAFDNALKRDKTGRHLTLTALGRLQLRLGKPGKAARSFRKALDFKRRRWQSVHLPALTGLAEALEALDRHEEAAEVRAELAREERHEGMA